MTLLFDEKARQEFANRKDKSELEYNGCPVKDMVVKPCSVKFARPYISTFHYSQSTPDSTKFAFAGWYGDKLAGICLFGMGANDSQYSYLLPDIQKGQYVELTRLWSPDSMPKNTESKLIAESLKLLPKEIKLVVSFADSQQSHEGYIYQATNWHYCGMTSGGKMLVDENGVVRHVKSINIFKKRHPELRGLTGEQVMDIYGWKYVEGGKKHRYCFLRGSKKEKKMNYEIIKDKIMSYPKDEQFSIFNL